MSRLSEFGRRLYDGAPMPFRTFAASARGFQLRLWRYGRETERYTEEALDRDHWNGARWKSWREETLSRLLVEASRKVPFYREHWAARRRSGDRSSVERLENWPILSKAAVRARPFAFVSDDGSPRRMLHETTSGTSGTPIHLWFARGAVRQWYGLVEARIRRWNGVTRHDRWAILGGQLVVPVRATKPPFWVWNAGLRQLYMSSYHLGNGAGASYADALARYGVRYVLGYASSLSLLAKDILAAGRQGPPLAVAISNAEPLLAHQRQAIEAAFGCPVRDTYGMCEIVCGASECPSGRLHQWPEAGVVEILEDQADAPVVPGHPGRLIATGLLNGLMPLVRYEVGDRAAIEPQSSCDCGRLLPMLKSIEGRSDDVIRTPSGRAVGRLDPVFKGDFRIREAQIIQEALDHLRVDVVSDGGFDEEQSARLSRALHERLGDDVTVRVRLVESIPRGANGKFRAVVSQLPTSGGRMAALEGRSA